MDELERLRTALGTSHSVVYEWDLEKNTITWSGDLARVLRIEDAKTVRDKEHFLKIVRKEDQPKYVSSREISIATGGEYTQTYRLTPPESSELEVLDRGAVVEKDGRKMLVGTLHTHNAHLFISSGLMQMPGKKQFFSDNEYFNSHFLTALENCFAEDQKQEESSVLLKVSIDNLAMMMTWYTLEFAERIMDALEKELREDIRKQDTIHRISVDQFGIILKNQTDSEVDQVVDRILRTVQMYKNPSFEEAIHLRTSIGSVRFPTFANNAQDALNKAYLALTSAREKSGEFYCDYNEAKREHLDSREQINRLNYMKSALQEDKLKIAYQPIISCRTGKVDNYECLLRIKEDDGSVVSAFSLIETAEKLGGIDLVDHFVLEKIVQELEEYPEIRLAINISNLTTENPKWLKTCNRLLADEALANRITVEITETAAQRNLRQTAYFVAAVQALGCKVALDDFGAGYTSFRQIKSLSVDVVKIDGSYIIGLEENSENLLFIRTLMDFNQSYGLETIAECVENGEVAKILMQEKVDYLQGYYFGAPDIARPWASERPAFEEHTV